MFYFKLIFFYFITTINIINLHSLSQQDNLPVNKDIYKLKSINNASNEETILKLNLLGLNNVLRADEICSNKLNNYFNDDENNNLSCCSSVISIYDNKEICEKRLLYENSISNKDKILKNEALQVKPYYKNYCDTNKYNNLVYNNITVNDYTNCVKYNELKAEKNTNYLYYYNRQAMNEKKRILQLNGLLNHFILPSASTHLMSQSILTEGSFIYQGAGPSCSPLFSLIFVRVCNTICNSHHNSSSGRNSIPMFCLRECQQFSKYACLRGCRKYGCNVDLYTCMELMCQ